MSAARYGAGKPACVAPDRAIGAAQPLGGLIAAAAQLPASASARERDLSQTLIAFGDRLRAHRFQLAVVGQFKRGKSSLLNALLGHEVLPTGVLPLTALPTFIRGGPEFELAVMTQAGPEAFRPGSAEALQEATAQFVAELANPANIKGVRQVEMTLPAPLLEAGLVLIDTPGVGSTVGHNTQAAEAALPECDAALMVLSPDPPITQAELDYLAKVRANAARVLIAFNKVDLASPADIAVSVTFLRDVLQGAGLDAEIFAVSARQALAALEAGDFVALADSGIPALRERLSSLSRVEGGGLLAQAIAQKAGAVARDLAFENDLILAALSAPLEVLDRRLGAFETARAAFDQERRAAADRLTGDRGRLLQQLDIDADAATQALRERLAKDVEAATPQVGTRVAWDHVRARIPEILAEDQVDFLDRQRAGLEAALAQHQSRADALLAQLRHTAADLMQVPYQAPASQDALVARAQPGWVDRPRESLADAPASLIERLAGRWGRHLTQRRVAGELHQLAVTNIEHLRWSIRLNIEETLRAFAAALDKALASGAAAIGDGLLATAAARRQSETQTDRSIADRTARRAALAKVIDALQPLTLTSQEA